MERILCYRIVRPKEDSIYEVGQHIIVSETFSQRAYEWQSWQEGDNLELFKPWDTYGMRWVSNSFVFMLFTVVGFGHCEHFISYGSWFPNKGANSFSLFWGKDRIKCIAFHMCQDQEF